MASTCEICLNSIQEFDRIFYCPNCNEDYHESHMQIWLSKNNKCPICKYVIKPEEIVRSKDREILNSLGINPNKYPDNKKLVREEITTMNKDYDDANKQLKNLDNKIDFSDAKVRVLHSQDFEPFKFSIKENNMKIMHYEIQFMIRFILKMRNYIFYSLSLGFFLLALYINFLEFQLQNLLYLPVPVLFSILHYNYQNVILTYFIDALDIDLVSIVIINPNVETNLGNPYLKLIKTSDITSINIFKVEKLETKRYIGFNLLNHANFILGDGYSSLGDDDIENFTKILADFLHLEIKVEKIEKNQLILKSKNISNLAEMSLFPSLECELVPTSFILIFLLIFLFDDITRIVILPLFIVMLVRFFIFLFESEIIKYKKSTVSKFVS